MINHIRSFLYKNSIFKAIKFYYFLKKGDILPIQELNLELAERVWIDHPIRPMKIGLVKERGYEKDAGYVNNRDYWPKFERFLLTNNILYQFYNVFSNDWIEEAHQYDLIIWHTYSSPIAKSEAESKIYYLEKVLGKKCVPSYKELWPYESKIRMHYLFRAYGLPEIDTFVTHSKEDAIKYIEQATYPLISKIDTGSSSVGVTKIGSKKEAVQFIDTIFSYKGRKSFWPDQRQKGYIVLQEFIPNALFDLRVIVVGDRLFGYYRYPKKGDFRASGTGIYEKKEIDKEALDIAWEVKQKFEARFLATDMLYDQRDEKYKIIEASFFIGIDTCEQLMVDGVPGYYHRIGNGYCFKPGRYWMQELLLLEVFSNLN